LKRVFAFKYSENIYKFLKHCVKYNTVFEEKNIITANMIYANFASIPVGFVCDDLKSSDINLQIP